MLAGNAREDEFQRYNIEVNGKRSVVRLPYQQLLNRGLSPGIGTRNFLLIYFKESELMKSTAATTFQSKARKPGLC